MGDRVSISFKRGDKESIALFDHWGGMMRVADAQGYVYELKRLVAKRLADRQANPNNAATRNYSAPLERFDPRFVMVDYIRQLELAERWNSDLYVGQITNPMYGDNSDNGHHVISLDDLDD